MSDLSKPSNESRLTELKSLASAKEAIKDYDAAADLYSQAAELQAKLNGEMALENADLLFSYGRCLYRVAVSKSDIFGSRAAVQTIADSTKVSSSHPPVASQDDTSPGAVSSKSNDAPISSKNHEATPVSQPYFQFNGDENFEEDDDDDDDDDNEDQNNDPGNEDDDFENAFETLDMARILLLRKLDTCSRSDCLTSELHELRDVKERLSDIYDIQAEISLESERFPDAVSDLRAALELKRELFPAHDSAVAECHYKLSLALEFCSVSQSNPEETPKVDTEMRNEAVEHLETAINCCRARIEIEEKKRSAIEATNTQEAMKAQREIHEMNEIVSDMNQRLKELRLPLRTIPRPETDQTSQNSILSQARLSNDQSVLKKIIGDANDLTSLVRKRKRGSSTDGKMNDAEKSTPSGA